MSDDRISSAALLSTLPAPLAADSHMHALAKVIADALAAHFSLTSVPAVFHNIDSIDGPALDMLAHDLNITWYDQNAAVAVKRQLISSARGVHMRSGTPASVKQVISDVLGGSASLEEWFDYSGSPFHFRIVSGGRILNTSEYNALMAQLDSVKNARSICDGISWRFDRSGSLHSVGFIGMGGAVLLTQAD